MGGRHSDAVSVISLGSEDAEAQVRRTYHDRRGNAPGGGRTMRDLSGAKHLATKAVWAGVEGYLVEGATQVPRGQVRVFEAPDPQSPRLDPGERSLTHLALSYMPGTGSLTSGREPGVCDLAQILGGGVSTRIRPE